ncbi:hypothetical protein AMATHDRAFT_1556 [Amanita thiersii Skay4041]|uniref:SH3 domain-containing protein n=1 Tax=Amanita thiersii Skay4041 TaxID=703135 RepID=A0A2A9NZ29_9AGAR|nr:hypothetical protein AMATHDRAFT_1556 [Amanita thiersii Skay4041]
MTAQDPQVVAMLAHIVSQIEINVEFLVSQNYISRTDATNILSKLPAPSVDVPASTYQAPAASVMRTPTASFPTPNFMPAQVPEAAAPPPRRNVPPTPTPAAPPVVQARAIWGYNEDRGEPNDLSFSAGDIIEIVEEVNADWWMGRIRGKQALFPSNYVEKLPPGAPVNSAPVSEKPVYRPFGAAYHGMNQPPPPGQGVNSIGLQEQDNTKKKSKFGGLGKTMANSAAGGVGFGAGAAVGSGLVNAIF